MRAKRMEQRSIFDSAYPDHDTGRALAAMSDLLDGHPEFLDWIAADVDRGGPSSRGRAGLPCEVVLRCGILKHLRRMDYRDLEFALVDSDLGETLHPRGSAASPEALRAAAVHRRRPSGDLGGDQPGPHGRGAGATGSRRAAGCASTAP